MTRSMLFGYPLFIVGLCCLGVGAVLSSYWPMAFGLLAMAFGALRFTETWVSPPSEVEDSQNQADI